MATLQVNELFTIHQTAKLMFSLKFSTDMVYVCYVCSEEKDGAGMSRQREERGGGGDGQEEGEEVGRRGIERENQRSS